MERYIDPGREKAWRLYEERELLGTPTEKMENTDKRYVTT
jgi:hypothetical protein